MSAVSMNFFRSVTISLLTCKCDFLGTFLPQRLNSRIIVY